MAKSHCYKINLGDAMLADFAMADLKVRLENIYISAGQPENMKAVYRHESSGLHCELLVYLSAEFQTAAKLSNAIRCDGFPQIDSAHLAGNEI
ncbi:hypothetical protein [Zhongshania aliphaticivorans]|nr:hypothetical protein [Zhongshania aliphaticivorans]